LRPGNLDPKVRCLFSPRLVAEYVLYKINNEYEYIIVYNSYEGRDISLQIEMGNSLWIKKEE